MLGDLKVLDLVEAVQRMAFECVGEGGGGRGFGQTCVFEVLGPFPLLAPCGVKTRFRGTEVSIG